MINGAPRINELSLAGQVVRARVRPSLMSLVFLVHASLSPMPNRECNGESHEF